ncbi:Protein charybde [Nesidiocoris tenuis]|uniref:Protein charybde n=1 Tax=Nesidiocoris tenuis TaxID=355587 RepID=A0ABN7B8A4_9HEMI|nr:Protein charybde [Nesidiocoris tenuis]
MAKARFPGRSLKSYNRKRVSTHGQVNYKESQGFRAAEDAYFRLSVFDHLFPEENEAPLFHGFSPHDVRTAVKEQAVLEIKRSWPEPAGEKAPKTRSGAPPVRGEPKFGPKNVLAASLEPKNTAPLRPSPARSSSYRQEAHTRRVLSSQTNVFSKAPAPSETQSDHGLTNRRRLTWNRPKFCRHR